MSGWIKIHRTITEHWLYTEKRVFSKFEAWNDILLTVNYTETKCLIKGKLYTVKRGQSILSLDNWGKRWGWDKSKVRRFMELLVNDSMVELITDNITTHLTVCKYEDYQDLRNANETRKKHKRNSYEIQTNTIKEGKESKEEEESKEIPFEILKTDLEIAFDCFLEMRKKIKKPATDRAIEMAKKKVMELSNGNEQLAIEIINQSTLNCWSDLYPLKQTQTQSTPSRRTTNEVVDKVKQEILNGQLEIKPII